MQGTVPECLQTERIYSCVLRSCGHSVEGGGGDGDQLSLNPVCFQKFSQSSVPLVLGCWPSGGWVIAMGPSELLGSGKNWA